MAVEPPEGTRLVVASIDLLDTFGTRADNGDRLTFSWGEPDENGWYTPTLTRHSDDNPIAEAVERERAQSADALRAAEELVAALESPFADPILSAAYYSAIADVKALATPDSTGARE